MEVVMHGPPYSVFTRHEDGRITVDDWYREQWFSKYFLDEVDIIGEYGLLYDPETELIEVRTANGRAVYRVVKWDHEWKIAKAMLVEAEIDVPG